MSRREMQGTELADIHPGSEFPRPVEIRIAPTPRWKPIIQLLLLFGSGIMIFIAMVITREIYSTSGDPLDAIMYLMIGIMFLLFIPVLVMYIRMLPVQMRANRVFLDTDVICMLRGDEVVSALQFDGRVRVFVTIPSGRNGLEFVKGFRLGRGLKGYNFFVSQEDAERLWPVLVAAVGKHGMKAGKRMRQLMDIEDG